MPNHPSGVGTYGFVIFKDDVKVYDERGIVGVGNGMSSNAAEYFSVVKALHRLLTTLMNDQKILVKSDSKLVVNQLTGIWRAKRGFYLKYYQLAKQMLENFSDISFHWIPGEENYLADALSKLAYSDHQSKQNNRSSK